MNANLLTKPGFSTFIARARSNRALTATMLLASLSIASAQTTLIYDSFSFSGNLNGTTPDTTVGGATWVAPVSPSLPPTADGSVLTVPVAQAQTDYLNLGSGYFANNPGIYTLSFDAAFPSGSTQTSWVALGFIDNPAVTGTMSPPGSGASPFLLYRTTGEVRVFGGQGTLNSLIGGGVYSFANGVTHTFTLVLDTSLSLWTVDAYVDSTQLDLNGASTGDTFTYSANPPSTMGNVAIGASPVGSDPNATVDNFTLTVQAVPEPSTFAFLLLGGLMFAGIARMRASKSV